MSLFQYALEQALLFFPPAPSHATARLSGLISDCIMLP